MILTYIILRSSCCLLAIAGAVLLAYEGKDGWGWLVFLALCLGMFNVNGTSD